MLCAYACAYTSVLICFYLENLHFEQVMISRWTCQTGLKVRGILGSSSHCYIKVMIKRMNTYAWITLEQNMFLFSQFPILRTWHFLSSDERLPGSCLFFRGIPCANVQVDHHTLLLLLQNIQVAPYIMRLWYVWKAYHWRSTWQTLDKIKDSSSGDGACEVCY